MKLFERLMNAITFAEAGLPDTALEMLNEKATAEAAARTAPAIPVTEVRPSLSAAIDRIQEAVTFAEAGEPAHAQAALAEAAPSPFGVLVVSHNDAFGRMVREHAVDFAVRRGRGIVALNVMETPRGSFFSRESAPLFEQFRARAERNAETFRRAAADRGVECVHLTTQGGVEKAVRIAHEKHPGLQFVITDPHSLGEESAPAGSISVFALAHNRG